MPALVNVKSQARTECNQKKYLSRIGLKPQDIYTYTHLHKLHCIWFVLIWVGLHIYTHVHTYTYICIHIHTFTFICIHIHAYTFMCNHIYRYTYILKTDTYIYIYKIQIHAFAHTHMHKHIRQRICIIIYIYTRIYMCVCVCVCMSVCPSVRPSVRLCVCMHACKYVCLWLCATVWVITLNTGLPKYLRNLKVLQYLAISSKILQYISPEFFNRQHEPPLTAGMVQNAT